MQLDLEIIIQVTYTPFKNKYFIINCIRDNFKIIKYLISNDRDNNNFLQQYQIIYLAVPTF